MIFWCEILRKFDINGSCICLSCISTLKNREKVRFQRYYLYVHLIIYVI